MANILTLDEAARVVSVDSTDEKLADVLPQVDSYIQTATGRDWTADSPVNPTAKAAARLYLALTYDLMAMQQNQIDALNRAIGSSLLQLESIQVGLKAIDDVNAAYDANDMLLCITSGALGLNLNEFNRLRLSGQHEAAQAVLSDRPHDGYSDVSTIQTALDSAVRPMLQQYL
jgi:hypothetical protein